MHFYQRPADEFEPSWSDVIADIKSTCFNAQFDRVLSLIEFFSREDFLIDPSLADEFNSVFEAYSVPYRLVDPGPSVIPMATEEEGQVVRQAFLDLGSDRFAGARKHLHDAGVYLGQPGKEAGSIRESIHAVESVCKVLAESPNATLTSALGRLKTKIPMHPAFATALEKLYSYTNDEKGIRHAQLGNEANADLADAQFMFGTCASFVSYLIGRARTAGLV